MPDRRILFPCLLVLAACGGGGGGGGTVSAPPPTPDPSPTITAIGEVQGSGDASPLDGQTVTISGVVTGDFQNGDGGGELGGFYVQGVPDADLDTSDAIFVFDGNNPAIDVSAGDSVRVTGTVDEFFGETQVQADTVSVVGFGNVLPANMIFNRDVVLNDDGLPIPDFEAFEGALVRFPNPLTVSESFDLDRYGELLLTENGRVIAFTNNNAPSVSGYADHLNDVASRSIILDDGNSDFDSRPVRYFDSDNVIRVGDTVTGLTGNLRYSRGSGGSGVQGWRLVPTIDPEFVSANPRTAAPNPGGSLRVASINVLNLFTGIDNGGNTCGPTSSSSCRGADSDAELDRQLQKITTALLAVDADIVGLVELENNANASLAAITDRLAASGAAYGFVDAGTIGTDAIKVGFIYRLSSVATSGDAAVLDSGVDSRFNDGKNRPVLAQSFRQLSNNAVLTVAINHLKSKGSDCDDVGDPDALDGQGNCNQTRTLAAEAMIDWLASDPTGSGDSDMLVIGDFNAYYREDPLTAFADAGYTNLVENLHGTSSYSFVFRGQSGALDHALASPSLASQVTGAVDWHVNADESRLLDYNLEGNREAAWFDGDEPYRASDHDPLVIGLQLTVSP